MRVPLLQIVAVGAVYAYLATDLGFTSWRSIKTILTLAALVGLASVGQTLLILIGGIDLSISGIIVGSALVVTVLPALWHITFLVALLIALGCGGTMAALAGYISHRFRVQPLIITLAVGAIAVGLTQTQTGEAFGGAAPRWLQNLASPQSHTFGVNVPPTLTIWLVVTLIMALVLHRTTMGRRLMATGANPEAAEYALVRTRRVWTLTFAFSGVCSVLVGVLVAGFAGSVDSGVGDPYLFQSVVAVIVGGTVFGGPGDYTRTAIGALFISLVTEALVGNNVSAAVQNMVYGAAILVAVSVYGRERRLRDRI
jgi:ribose transport system permease protein